MIAQGWETPPGRNRKCLYNARRFSMRRRSALAFCSSALGPRWIFVRCERVYTRPCNRLCSAFRRCCTCTLGQSARIKFAFQREQRSRGSVIATVFLLFRPPQRLGEEIGCLVVSRSMLGNLFATDAFSRSELAGTVMDRVGGQSAGSCARSPYVYYACMHIDTFPSTDVTGQSPLSSRCRG